MSKENKKFILVLDLVRVLNVINLSLFLGLVLSFLGINGYVSLLFVLFMSVFLSIITQKLFVKRFGSKISVSNNKVFYYFTVLVNVAMFVYYVLIKEYGVLLILLMFYLLYFAITNKIQRNKSQLIKS